MKTLAFSAFAALGLSLASPAQAATNIVVNGGFDTGLAGFTVNPGTGSGTDINVANGLIYTPCCGTSVGNSGVGLANNFAAFGGGNVPNQSTLSQALNTVAGTTYYLSYKLTALGGGTEQFLAQVIGGMGSLAQRIDTATAGAPYVTYTLAFVANSPTTTIAFSVFPLNSGLADNIDPILDDVAVVAAPEPATWLMMIFGFGFAGSMIRRRKIKDLAYA